jgi:hypothetical protein
MTDNDKTELSHLNPTNANSDCTGKSKKIRSSNPVESLNSTSELLTLAKDVVNNYEQYPIDFESSSWRKSADKRIYLLLYDLSRMKLNQLIA